MLCRYLRGRTSALLQLDGNEARLLTYTNSFLYALDPKTGQPFRNFGDGGKVDLTAGMGPLMRTYRWNSTPLVVRDVVVMGSAMADQDSASKKEGAPGDVRGVYSYSAYSYSASFGLPGERLSGERIRTDRAVHPSLPVPWPASRPRPAAA